MLGSIDRYLDSLYGRAPRKLSVTAALGSGMPLALWRSELRGALLKSMGEWPESVALGVTEISRTDRPDHVQVKLSYRSEPELETIAYLLIPKAVQFPCPAVVACTGHGYGVRDVVGIAEDFTEREGDPGYQKDFGVQLVRRGFVVIAPEPLGFGEMMLTGDRGNSCNRISDNLLLLGRTMIAARVQQYIAAITLVSQMPEVDATRIGAMGISGGGLASSFLTMIDPRVRALVCSGYPCMYHDSIYGMFHCVDNFPFGLLNYAENDDLMSLIAPRPMLWESGSHDPIFPRPGVERAAETVRRVYAHLDAQHAFEVDYFEGEHEISGRRAYDFLVEHL